MKKSIILIALLVYQLSFLSSPLLFAQSTEIRPGTLLPQMTTAQRTALSATNGMLVFDTNTQSYWFRQSGTWVNLSAGGGSNYWQLSGAGSNEIQNTNTGGFWSANPTGLNNNSTDVTHPPTAPMSGAGTRLMWIPSRSAFRVGTITGNQWDAANIGLFSFASGLNSKASGPTSTAIGENTIASGNNSTTMGSSTTASGVSSTAMGSYTNASGVSSTAIGNYTTASGNNSTAMGGSTTASGSGSTATGYSTTASGIYSTAIGNYAIASGIVSTAMGDNTTARGEASTAMGYYTTAGGNYSTAMGYSTTARGVASTAMGYYTTASGNYSTAMGYNTTASGIYSTAMGFATIASREASTAIGTYNVDNPNAIFMVGNGTANNNKANVFTIRGDNNYVGIGTDNPIAPLHVAGQSTITGGTSGRHFNYASNIFSYIGTEYPSIVADASIISKTTIGAFQTITASDARTKTILNRSDNVADLDLLKKIQITNYRMKDEGTWGKQIFKKVIAQEVEEIYPEAVRQQTSIIPDIYALAEKVSYDANKKELTVSLLKNYGLKIDDKIELIHPEKGKVRATIVVVSGNSFTVKDWLYETDKIFVFGREVNDFRVIDYEALSMLGISAIQQLAKENEGLKSRVERLENLEKRLRDLEAKSNTSMVLK